MSLCMHGAWVQLRNTYGYAVKVWNMCKTCQIYIGFGVKNVGWKFHTRANLGIDTTYYIYIIHSPSFKSLYLLIMC